MVSPLELIGIALLTVHFASPLVYYMYARRRWYNREWSLVYREDYKPRVSIIIPTFNEADVIEQRLDNIYSQDYPRDLVEVIVIDSASTDGTPSRVAEWAKKHSDLRVKLIVEETRRGKAYALNNALKHANGEIIVLADADALWSRDALSRAVKYLSSEEIGAVSCIKVPLRKGLLGVEKGYRDHYNVLRVAESKAYSTPIFHGELAAFKADLLRQIGGFPVDIGADDSHVATLIAINGYRAIIPEDVIAYESIPVKGYFKWRTRRAQHLVQHFIKVLGYWKRNKSFSKILIAETFLHIVNPWILLLSLILLLASMVSTLPSIQYTSIMLLIGGTALLFLKSFRTWIITQLILIAGMLRNIYTKELVWEKQRK